MNNKSHVKLYTIQFLMDGVREYFQNTSFHGLPFLTQPGRHWIERLFWLGCISASWYLCILLITTSYDGYENHSISFGTDTDYIEWNTSLFSVAVCENNNKDGVYAYGEKLWGKKHDYNLDEVLMEIAYFKGEHYFMHTFCVPGPKALKCPENDFLNLSNAVRSPCTKIFQSCKWNNKAIPCCLYFLKMNTERGPCYVSNSLQVDDPKPFPMISNRYVGPGKLNLDLKVQAEVYVMAAEETAFINAPSVEYVTAQRGLSKKRVYSITEMVNGPAVASVPISKRNCRFPYENNLEVHKAYSYMTCVVECRERKQIELCGCVSHLNSGRDPSLACNLTGLLCLIKHAERYSILVNSKATRQGLVCDHCVPSCLEPEYELIEQEDKGQKENYASVELKLQRLPTLRLKRTVVRSLLDLVVSMGGSVGLFAGASLLSFVELIYFCTLRAWYRPQRQHHGMYPTKFVSKK